MNNDCCAHSWEELNALLWKDSLDPARAEYRPYVAYRGLPEDYGNLRTALQRLGDPGPQLTPDELRWRERRIIDSFRKYARPRLTYGHSDWDVMLLGQHYRLPTRLLDWTSNPFAALFFCTEDLQRDEKDGVIWCVLRIETNRHLPAPFDELHARQEPSLLSLEILRDRFPSVSEFDASSADALLWFEPPALTPRIVNQYAFFSVMPSVDGRHCNWLAKHPDLHWRVRVPARLKREIRQRLQVMNVTERVIYPGLEGIARWLRSYYSAPNMPLEATGVAGRRAGMR